MGRKVEITKSPERIISLAPSLTEILFYLDLGERVIGVTDFCNYPEEARKRPSIGWLISPNLEKIISLKPDLVFATAEGNRADIVATLERVHVKVYVLSPHSLEDILQEVVSIGKITGQEEIARERVSNLSKRIEAVRKRAEGEKKVRVLYLASADPIISVGPGSFIHDIIEISGGDNIASQSFTRYPRIEMEEIILKDPEVIIAPPDIIETIRSWKSRWDGISAVRHHRIYSIDIDIISRPGPRIVDGLESIYGYLHLKDKEN
jgi:iron complex transport system substrate-binding protein